MAVDDVTVKFEIWDTAGTCPRGVEGGGVTRPCARARQAKRVLTQGRTGASREKSLEMT